MKPERSLPLAALLFLGPAWADHELNLLDNGRFDENVAAWQSFGATPTWSPDDAQALPFSGSMQFQVGGDVPLGVRQCVTAPSLDELQAGMDIRQSAGAGNGFGVLSVSWFSDSSCTTSISGETPPFIVLSPDWQRRRAIFARPATAESARLFIGGGTSSGGATLQMDNIYFGPRRLFHDRFEQRTAP
ncbi:hypothetical protein [Wenzhouxiangella sediminis]|uniref:Uncharacterized protein n=1 Tax=Wenzhouxiangella sediminis TaxID=1792836 RepID=A0A3E1KB70_9GAMM|nr:hypothetical protein [Wenzhouxiangella sediminis]RFF31767.1 hypothetical protein DZC52_03720 [Wenzhouxiangella sediminis]